MLEKVKDLSWEDVFEIWRQNEGSNPKWIEHAKENGFASWEEWRNMYAKDLNLAERNWTLYKITDPLKTIPTFRGGPFKTWIQRHYGGHPRPTFAELAQREDMQNNKDNVNILDNFPQETTITGLKQDASVIIIEGMHRCVAIALAAQQGKELDTTVHITLADATGEELPVIGQYRKT